MTQLSTSKNSITLVNPRHNVSPSDGEGSYYLPTSLFVIASQLRQAGKNIIFLDQNFETDHNTRPNTDVVGMTLLGAPYLPEAQKFYDNQLNKNQKLLLGGQIVNTVTPDEFQKIFKENPNIIQGNTAQSLMDVLSIAKPLIEREHTSLIPGYELVDDEKWKEYLDPKREISLYLSQGCKYNCTFCTAVKGTPEKYRDLDKVETDLEWLVEKSISLGYNQLNSYVSNLDVLQTPDKLYEFCMTVQSLQKKYPYFCFNFRGLSTIESGHKLFMNPKEKINNTDITKGELITLLRTVGFSRIGYGVDGVGKEVWKSTHKPNDVQKMLDVMKYTSESEFTPETLMVFGHGADTEETMKEAVETAQKLWELYGAIPRPHSAKDIPGNEGWKTHPNQEYFLQNSQYLQNLDFTAMPSKLTHPDDTLRRRAKKYYLKMCYLEGSETLPLRPYQPGMSEAQKESVRRFNQKRYDH